jgi:hypothetical protein
MLHVGECRQLVDRQLQLPRLRMGRKRGGRGRAKRTQIAVDVKWHNPYQPPQQLYQPWPAADVQGADSSAQLRNAQQNWAGSYQQRGQPPAAQNLSLPDGNISMGGYIVTPRGGVYSPDAFKVTKSPPAVPAQPLESKEHNPVAMQPFDYYGVLDFECTCDMRDDPANPWLHEIIEFPVVLVDPATMQVVDEFHYFVTPTERPEITPFCTELTGITQDMVSRGIALPDSLIRFDEWLASYEIGPDRKYSIALVTDGPWDL